MNRSFSRKLFVPRVQGTGADGEEGFSTGAVVFALIGGVAAGAFAMHYLMTPETPLQRAPAFVPPPRYVPPAEARMQQQYDLHMQRPEIQQSIVRARVQNKFQRGHALTRDEYEMLRAMEEGP